MQYYRCKCGKTEAWDSGLGNPACAGCNECGTTLVQHPGEHKPREPHTIIIKYKDDGTPFEWCERCYATIRTLHRPLMLPGLLSTHQRITDECRADSGDDGAIAEVILRLREHLESTLSGTKLGKGMKIHIGMTVERSE